MRAMRLLLLAVAATTALLVGCGAAENDPNLAASIRKTEALGSGRFDANGSVRENGNAVSLSCNGSADYDRKRVHVRCEYEGAGAFEAIAIRNDLYMRGDAAFGSGSTDKWVKETQDLGEDNALANLSPQHIFTLLRNASSQTERVGDEDVRGDETTRYRLTVDCESADLACDSSAPVDVWIADDGTVRRIALEDDDGEVTFEFFDFGTEVAVDPPPADQVEDLSDAVKPHPCGGAEAGPISVPEAIATLKANGFDVSDEGVECFGNMAGSISNSSSGDTEPPVSCVVLLTAPSAGGAPTFELGPVTDIGIKPIVEEVANIRCWLFADAERTAARDRLDAAFSEFERMAHS